MNIRSPISNIESFIRRKPGGSEVDAMINLLPEAAIIADFEKWIIVACNSKAAELSSFTRTELLERSVDSLFEQPDSILEKLHEIFLNNDNPNMPICSNGVEFVYPSYVKPTVLMPQRAFI